MAEHDNVGYCATNPTRFMKYHLGMKLSQYAVQGLVPIINGDEYPPRRNGPTLVKLFNEYGCRDVYDFKGLPVNPDVKNGQRMSRKQYVENRLNQISGTVGLRSLIEKVVNDADDKVGTASAVNKILQGEGYVVQEVEGYYSISGGVIDKTLPVQNDAEFHEIQDKILKELDNAKVSIWLAMAWFTNEVLFKKLVEKKDQGVDVQLVIFDDGINKKYGVDFTRLDYKPIKKTLYGGTMHHKFCVIDNQIVITGSYNWTNNAEYRNKENVTIEKDPLQATKYSVEFRNLRNQSQ